MHSEHDKPAHTDLELDDAHLDRFDAPHCQKTGLVAHVHEEVFAGYRPGFVDNCTWWALTKPDRVSPIVLLHGGKHHLDRQGPGNAVIRSFQRRDPETHTLNRDALIELGFDPDDPEQDAPIGRAGFDYDLKLNAVVSNDHVDVLGRVDDDALLDAIRLEIRCEIARRCAEQVWRDVWNALHADFQAIVRRKPSAIDADLIGTPPADAHLDRLHRRLDGEGPEGEFDDRVWAAFEKRYEETTAGVVEAFRKVARG